MRITLLILLFLFSQTLLSQQDSVLKKFKYRIDYYQAIGFSIGGAGQFINSDYGSDIQKNQSAGGNASGYYTLLKSTEKILLNVGANILTYYDGSRSDNASNSNKNRSRNISPSVYLSNKWFGKKIFTELGTNISAGSQKNKQDISGSLPENEVTGKQHSYSAALTLGIGKGRLENIRDMQNALWLYKALQDENKLQRPLSADELNDLGRTITKANNTRVLDNRKRIQFILETTDSFFKSNNLVSDCDIRYFSTLNDILFYAINNQRFSGTEIYLRVTPEIKYLVNDVTSKTPSTKEQGTNNTRSLRVAAGINKYVPANLKHQNDYGGSVFVSSFYWKEINKSFLSGTQTSTNEYGSTLKQAGMTAFFQHAIYLTTRSIINFDLNGETGYEAIDDDETFYGMAGISCSFNYFVSYRTRLTGGLGMIYQKNVYEKTYYLSLLPERLFFNSSIGLQVSL